MGGRISLPDNVIDIRRVAWLPSGIIYKPTALRQADAMSKSFYDRGWMGAAAAPPRTYLQSSQPPLSFDVDRTPPVAGNYEVMAVEAGAALVTTAPAVLGVPDDWAWVIKFGALSELFGLESEAKDQMRSDYCAWRYKQGLALMMDAPAVLSAQIGSSICAIDAVANADDFNPGWQASVLTGLPRSVYLAGQNMLAPSSPWVSGMTLQVVQNAPIPSVSTDPIQLGREDYAAVLDEAQHLATLSLGGSEFMATVGLHKRFIERAALYNSKLLGLGDYPRSMYEISQLESERAPVYGGVKPQEVLGGGNQ